MKSIYKITKGQLLTIWIFGAIGWLFTLEQVDYSGLAVFFFISIPAILIFYTIGWRHHRKNVISEAIQNTVEKKRSYKPLLIIASVLLVLVGAFAYGSFEIFEVRAEKERKENYIGSVNRFKKLYENAQKCVEEKVNTSKSFYISACQKQHDDAYASYKNCRKDMYWQDHYDCINWPGSDYESIDCSEETIVVELKSKFGPSCNLEVDTVFRDIVAYEENLIDKFISSQDKSKANFDTKELQQLYNSFPEEVFNEATKDRINKYLEEQGYELNN